MKMDKKDKEDKTKKAKEGKEKVIKDLGKKKKLKKKQRAVRFDAFIHRVLKQIHPNIGITKQAMHVMNDLVVSAFNDISDESSKLLKLDGRDTLNARDVACAVRLVLPGELASHSNEEGTNAIRHFQESSKGRVK